MESNFSELLTVVFVWRNSDKNLVGKLVDKCYHYLSNDTRSPFSRSLDIPVFFRTGDETDSLEPIDYDSEITLVFPFVTDAIITRDEWTSWIEDQCNIINCSKKVLIPIGMCPSSGRAFQGCVAEIRNIDYNGDDPSEDRIIFRILHEIYRWAVSSDKQYDEKCNLFLSHTKSDDKGTEAAIAIRDFINKNEGRIGVFFDCKSLLRGKESDRDRFDKQFFEEINKSTLLAVCSDSYSSRHWCQVEMIHAKKSSRPIVLVDVSKEYEDRRFPHAANVPCVYPGTPLDSSALTRIILIAMVETLRFNYAKKRLERLSKGMKNVLILARPPEFLDLKKITENIKGEHPVVIYPDPPLFEEEKQHFEDIGIRTCTPLTIRAHPLLDGRKIGISISEIDHGDSLFKIGQGEAHLTFFSASLAKNLLSTRATIVYGGDFRSGSFAYVMLEEARIMADRLTAVGRDNGLRKPIWEFVSWPFHMQEGFDSSISAWCGASGVMKLERCPSPRMEDINDSLDVLTLNNDRKLWDDALRVMRNKMIRCCDYRICAGGKISTYRGLMPGVLQEVMIALDEKKPLFLAGGFGGITSAICKVIFGDSHVEELSDEFHERICGKDILEKNRVDYVEIVNRLSKINIDWPKNENGDNLNNGLSKEENIRLFNTPYTNEAMSLIFKGLSISLDDNSCVD